MNSRIAGCAAAMAFALSPIGCYVTADPVPVAYASVDEGPAEVDVQTAPRAAYDGRPVYFVHDRWYYRDGARWAYYRQEPAELHRQRPYVKEAPRARR